MSRGRRLLRCEAGTAAIEFAFIGLLLFTVTIGLVEAGRAFFLMNELSHAADRAARAVMLNFEIEGDDLTTLVQDDDFLTGLTPASVLVDSPMPSTADMFRNVRLSYPFTPIIAGFTLGGATLSTDRQVAR
ncbi:TadE-like protein [Palleronia aestuarii]|uniref:TadE-like protein n=1 Tax=Palleronia aestuarii TaxID=568105 RepID=A0A2W7MZ88_9RHOB|nr:TadE family protein [Palleronia aestuarii]PZX13120.1 TadE-like protein [Palleronia aestuarii]